MSKLNHSIAAIAIAVVAIFLMWYFSNIVCYIVVSFVLTILGNPLVALLEKIKIGNFRIPRWLSSGIVLLVMWAVAFIGFYLFVPLVIDKVIELASMDYSSVYEYFREPMQRIESFLKDVLPPEQAEQSIGQIISQKISSVINLDTVNRMFSSLTDTLANLVIALFSISFITFFFLKDDRLFGNMLTMVLPRRYEENLKRSLCSINKLLERYFVGIFCESSIMLIFVTVGLRIIGVSLSDAMVVGLISSVLNVIPYVGPIVGATIGVFIGVVSVGTVGDVSLIWQIILVFILFQTLDNLVLQPIIYSNSVKAHPLEIFLVILIAGSLAGIVGMLFAIPGYTVLRILAKEFFNEFRVVQSLTKNLN